MSNTNMIGEDGPIGQYVSDHMVYAGSNALHTDDLGIKTRGDGRFGFHGTHTLFDEGNGHVDEATGVFNTDIGDEGLVLEGMRVGVVRERRGRSTEKPVDAAEDWLKANDPDYH